MRICIEQPEGCQQNLRAALEYAADWAVFPVPPGTKRSYKSDSGRPSRIVSFISGLSKNLPLKGRILSERATIGWRRRSDRS